MDEVEMTELLENERLRWISFFHYVSGGLTIAFSSMFIFHLILMAYFTSNPELFRTENVEEVEQSLQLMRVFLGVFGTIVIVGIVYGICEIVSGIFIRRRKFRMFSLIVAIPRVIFVPYGTILSIFTFMLLERDTVKQQYENSKNTSTANN